MILFRERGRKSAMAPGWLAFIDARFGVAGLAIHAVCRQRGTRTVGHLKVILLFIEECGIFWCSQRAALIDPHRLRGAFLGCAYDHAIYSLIREGFTFGAVGICKLNKENWCLT